MSERQETGGVQEGESVDWDRMMHAAFGATESPLAPRVWMACARDVVVEYQRQRRAAGYVEVRREDLELYFDFLDRADQAEFAGRGDLWPEPPVIAAKHRLDAALAQEDTDGH